MSTLRQLVRDITGKTLVLIPDCDWWTRHYTRIIEVGVVLSDTGRVVHKDLREKVLHEVLHWVVADDWQRVHEDNLGFDHEDGLMSPRDKERQERMVCHLERLLYNLSGQVLPQNPSCGPIRLASRLTPDEISGMMAKCNEIGWGRLVALARVRS